MNSKVAAVVKPLSEETIFAITCRRRWQKGDEQRVSVYSEHTPVSISSGAALVEAIFSVETTAFETGNNASRSQSLATLSDSLEQCWKV